MKPITITADFSGYPDGITERVFRIGEEPTDLDDDYADLLIAKGYAEEAKPAAAASKPAVPAADPAPAKTEVAPGTRASVPFMVTQAARQQLRDLGKTEDEITRMTPAEAQDALAAGQKKDDAK